MVRHAAHETSPQHAVHHPVVVAVAEEHHVPDGNHIPMFRLQNGRALADGPKCQNADLRLVDDGRTHDVSKGPHIAHRVGSSGNVVGGQLARARPSGEVVHLTRQSLEIVLVRVLDHRHNQIA